MVCQLDAIQNEVHITQCEGAFVYSNSTFTDVFPQESNKSINANCTLNDFCKDIGIPEKLASNRALELCGRNSAFLATAKWKGIDLSYAKPEQKNLIWKVDLEIRELKKRWHNKMRTKNAPKRLWDFGIKHSAKIMQLLPRTMR